MSGVMPSAIPGTAPAKQPLLVHFPFVSHNYRRIWGHRTKTVKISEFSSIRYDVPTLCSSCHEFLEHDERGLPFCLICNLGPETSESKKSEKQRVHEEHIFLNEIKYRESKDGRLRQRTARSQSEAVQKTDPPLRSMSRPRSHRVVHRATVSGLE